MGKTRLEGRWWQTVSGRYAVQNRLHQRSWLIHLAENGERSNAPEHIGAACLRALKHVDERPQPRLE